MSLEAVSSPTMETTATATDYDDLQTTTTTTTSKSQNLREQLFQKRLTELTTFHTKNGHGSIPTPYPPNPPLGIWAANLRRQYVLRQNAEQKGEGYIGYLTSSRQGQLVNVGFDFSSLTERQFQMRLQELEMFKERYGHCMVPEKWEENLALGAWVSNIRSLYKRKRLIDDKTNIEKKQKKRRGRKTLLKSSRDERNRTPRFSHLDEERITLLEEMGFVWSSTDRKWLEMLEWAKVYGVVSHETKLLPGGDGLEEDVYEDDVDNDGRASPMDGSDGDVAIQLGQNGTAQHNHRNHTLLLANYQHFVHNIQDQSLLPSFHPQDKILTLLLDEMHAQNDVLGQQPQQPLSVHQASSLLQSNNDDTQLPNFQSNCLNYRISPNDVLNQPLRIWMINQRSNYHRLHRSNNNQTQEESPQSLIPSTMTPQRQQALEEIHFPWSGRFTNRISENEYEAEQLAKKERELKKERRIQQKEQKEREIVESLTSSIVATVSSDASSGGVGVVVVEEEEVDVMSLWGAEDDDDDDW